MDRLPILLVLALCACRGADAGGSRPDALPVTESSPPYPAWSLGATPVARIGAVDGPPELQLSRVGFAGRLSDGRFVVFDGGSSEVRWYAPDGAFLRRAGGEGQGPGEFEGVVAGAVTPADSVVLYDFRNQRLTWLGPDGSLGRTLRVDLPGAVTLAPLDRARLVVAEERLVFNFGGAELNRSRDSLLVMVEPGASQPLDTLLVRPGRGAATWIQYTDGKPTATRQFQLPFSHPTLVGAAAGRVVIVGEGESDLAFLDGGGDVVRSARRTDADALPLSASLRDRYVTNALETARAQDRPEGPAKALAEGLLALVPEGQRVSPSDRILTDAAAGRVWVRDYVFDWQENEPRRWTVHDSAGRVLARVTTPPGLDVMQVGPEGVVGVERGTLGVEYVVGYALEQRGGSDG